MKPFVLWLAMAVLVQGSTLQADDLAIRSPLKTQLRVERPEGLTVRTFVEDEAPVSFAGTWKTIAGGTHQYTVILNQVDNEVSGSYAPGNGKIFDGVVTESKLAFKWTQDGGFEGIGEFTMDEDGKGFTGSSTSLKPQESTNTWNTYEPEPAWFAGNWETISDGQNSHLLTVVQSGNKVTGVFPSNNGKLEGTVSGKVLRFKWESDSGTGSGRFVMDESMFAFTGTYNRGDNPDDVDATWNGMRKAFTGGKTPPASFAGAWAVVRNGKSGSLDVKQVGNELRVGYRAENTDRYAAYITEATVVGNTLRFKWGLRKNVKEGQLVMDEGGKSFKGTIDGSPVTGTFVRPLDR